jgi:hypothetical protein
VVAAIPVETLVAAIPAAEEVTSLSETKGLGLRPQPNLRM